MPLLNGIERNLVITMWEWGAKDWVDLYNVVASEQAEPINATADPVDGVDTQNDLLTIVDPATHESSSLKILMGVNSSRANPAAMGLQPRIIRRWIGRAASGSRRESEVDALGLVQ